MGPLGRETQKWVSGRVGPCRRAAPISPSAQQGPGRGAGHAPRCELPAALTPVGAEESHSHPPPPGPRLVHKLQLSEAQRGCGLTHFHLRTVFAESCLSGSALSSGRWPPSAQRTERVRSRRRSPGPDRPQGFQSSGRGGDCPSTPNPGLG